MNDAAWALTAAGLERVLAEIDGGRDLVVECGSGASTVAIGRLLAERGTGRLFSLEHDRRWYADTAARLERAGASERVELLHAPLRDGWYDPAALRRLPDGIELLLVDGPPGELDPNGEARYPALPALAGRLLEGTLVILDDIHRPGERRVLQRWQREHRINFELNSEERLAIGVFSAQ